MTPVIAILDIGKTNKKVFLFDRAYRIVWEHTEQFTETTDDDGDPCEDLARLSTWVLESVRRVLAMPEYEVWAINFSAYGASLVYVGADGEPVGYLYSYLKPFPDDLRQQFYDAYGPVDTLSVQTASPALDSLNSGLMLYRVKYDKPELFGQIRYALHLPQYLSYLLTRQAVSDLTSIGCHTTLWDFPNQQYHHWVEAEGLGTRLGPIFSGDATLPAATLADLPNGINVPVGVGLHDSSAALIPYLASFDEPFLLISTGTWCISMNPFNSQPLTAEELQYDCLCYLTYKGQPVKASRLFAGHEHEQQVRRLAEHFNVAVDTYKHVAYNADIITELQDVVPEPVDETGGIIPPQTMPSLAQSAFTQRDLAQYADYETAYHQLMLDLMAQQLISTALVLPEQSQVKRIFVDGGFGKNAIYLNLLAAAFPDVEVWAASVAQATALGAALAIHDQWNEGPVPEGLITLKAP